MDQNDFDCMALRACIIEGKGACVPAKLTEYQRIMRSLWDEISDLADFDKVCGSNVLFAFSLAKISQYLLMRRLSVALYNH